MSRKKSDGKEAENIKVLVRCRPLSQKEKEMGYKSSVDMDIGEGTVTVRHVCGDPDRWTFDAVMNNTSTQADIFSVYVTPMIESVLGGFNSTIFAYGQSGSGKTYTMTGTPDMRDLAGVIPRSFDCIFSHISETSRNGTTYNLYCSYLEIYNGQAHDLLSRTATNLKIKESKDKTFFVQDLSQPQVKFQADLFRLMEEGTERRKVASTELNTDSSRSHSIFTVYIQKEEHTEDGDIRSVTSKLNLVDLAGSERQSKTGTTGDALKEGCNINLSLSALGTVIDTIVKGRGHIPYRSSPLTMLLKDSLGGGSKTCMFANINPSEHNISETVSTLRFADRAKQIKNKPLVQMDAKDQKITELSNKIEELKERLKKFESSGLKELETENEQLQEHVNELEVQLESVSEVMTRNGNDMKEQLDAALRESEVATETAKDKERELETYTKEHSVLQQQLQSESVLLSELREIVTSFIATQTNELHSDPLDVYAIQHQLQQLDSQSKTDISPEAENAIKEERLKHEAILSEANVEAIKERERLTVISNQAQASLKEAITRMEKMKAKLESERSKRKTALAAKDEEVAALKRSRDTETSRLKAMIAELEGHLISDIQRKASDLDQQETRTDVATLETELSALSTKYMKLVKEKEKTETRLASMTGDETEVVAVLKEELAAAQDRSRTVDQEHTASTYKLNNEIKNLRALLSQARPANEIHQLHPAQGELVNSVSPMQQHLLINTANPSKVPVPDETPVPVPATPQPPTHSNTASPRTNSFKRARTDEPQQEQTNQLEPVAKALTLEHAASTLSNQGSATTMQPSPDASDLKSPCGAAMGSVQGEYRMTELLQAVQAPVLVAEHETPVLVEQQAQSHQQAAVTVQAPMQAPVPQEQTTEQQSQEQMQTVQSKGHTQPQEDVQGQAQLPAVRAEPTPSVEGAQVKQVQQVSQVPQVPQAPQVRLTQEETQQGQVQQTRSPRQHAGEPKPHPLTPAFSSLSLSGGEELLKAECEKLRRMIEMQKQDNEGLQMEVKKYVAKDGDMAAAVDELTAEVESGRKELEEEVEKVSVARGEQVVLLKEVEQLNMKITGMAREAGVVQQQVDDERKKIEKYEKSLTAKFADLMVIEKQLEDKNNTITETKGMVRNLQDVISDLREKEKIHLGRLTEAKKTTDERDVYWQGHLEEQEKKMTQMMTRKAQEIRDQHKIESKKKTTEIERLFKKIRKGEAATQKVKERYDMKVVQYEQLVKDFESYKLKILERDKGDGDDVLDTAENIQRIIKTAKVSKVLREDTHMRQIGTSDTPDVEQAMMRKSAAAKKFSVQMDSPPTQRRVITVKPTSSHSITNDLPSHQFDPGFPRQSIKDLALHSPLSNRRPIPSPRSDISPPPIFASAPLGALGSNNTAITATTTITTAEPKTSFPSPPAHRPTMGLDPPILQRRQLDEQPNESMAAVLGGVLRPTPPS